MKNGRSRSSSYLYLSIPLIGNPSGDSCLLRRISVDLLLVSNKENVKIDILPNDTWLPERALIHQSFRMTVFSCFVIDDKTRISFQYNEKKLVIHFKYMGMFSVNWFLQCNAFEGLVLRTYIYKASYCYYKGTPLG